MNQQTKEYLERQFGNRVNFDEMERVLYSHDIAAIPSLIAAAHRQNHSRCRLFSPKTKKSWLLSLIGPGQNNIALTPRAKASSGYGGVLPVKARNCR